MARFNVLNHMLVPLHELLSETEENELLRRMAIQPEQLPKIKLNDPALKALAAKTGTILAGRIIKITRQSETMGESVVYRIVIEG